MQRIFKIKLVSISLWPMFKARIAVIAGVDSGCIYLAIKTILCELMLHNVAAGQLDEVALL